MPPTTQPVTILVLLLFLGGAGLRAQSDAIKQGYLVYQNGSNTEARGRITNEVVETGGDAGAVLSAVLQRLDRQGGGKLELEVGTYTINAPLDLPSSVSISGSGWATVLQLGSEHAAGEGTIFRAQDQDHIQISDLTLVGAESDSTSCGIDLVGTGMSTIRGVYARNFSGFGIRLRDHSFGNMLTGNYTSGNLRAGTMIGQNDATRGGRFAPNKLIGCYSYADKGNGFEFDRAICQDIVGCVAYLSGKHGIHMYESTSNLISGNRIFMCLGDGIRIDDTYEMNISSNICGWNQGDNLTLNHCVWATVTANEFIDGGGRKREGYGIYMERGCKAVQITGNAIFNWWDNQALSAGIYEGEDCFDNQITDNIINYYKDGAVISKGERTVADYNVGLPNPFAWPMLGPNAPDVKPEDIKLNLSIEESMEMARKYFAAQERGAETGEE